MYSSEAILGLPDFEITAIERNGGQVRICARYKGIAACPECQSQNLRDKGRYTRRVRHETWGTRHVWLELEAHKWRCRDCGRYFQQRFPGILPAQRATEAFRKSVFQAHWDGINRRRLGQREGIGAATVERHFQHVLGRLVRERRSDRCPRVLGIDEHFFTRKKGFATTFCDLRHHKIFDVVLGRSEASLESYLQKLKDKDKVTIICMDLSSTYRALVRKHFPHARIVADRFHVIRLINQHFLACWRDLDPVAAKNRGLLSLMRRHRHNLKPEQKLKLAAYLAQHPVLQTVYSFKQHLTYLLLKKQRTRRQCKRLIPRLLRALEHLCQAGLPQLTALGQTLSSWSAEIAAMWRFTRSNGITEGFHNKMEVLSRQAYGFRNFENYRARVQVLCS